MLPFFCPSLKNTKRPKMRMQVQNAVDAVSKSGDLREDGGDDLPKDLKTVCYFSFKVFLY
jgi:hypothetical protein